VVGLLALLPSPPGECDDAALTILRGNSGLHRIDILIDADFGRILLLLLLTGMLACLVYRALAAFGDVAHTSNALAVAVALALFYLSGWEYPGYGASFSCCACG